MSRQNVLWGAGALLAVAVIGGIVALFSFSSHGGSAVSPTQLQAQTVANVSPPPRGALVLGAEAGKRAVAIALQPRALTATVLAPSGDPDSGLKVSFRVEGATLRGKPCGSGCYRAAITARPNRVEVVLPSGSASFVIPAATRPGAKIVARAQRVFSGLSSLVYVESLRSGPTGGIVTTWKMAAPNRLSYQIHGRSAAVVIGDRRWDQTKPGGKWVESQSTALQVPAPTWGSDVEDPNVLGSATVDGRSVWIVSFVTPSVPAWFTAWIDKRSDRTLQLKMTAAGHFMFHRYTQFNAPLKIVPPR